MIRRLRTTAAVPFAVSVACLPYWLLAACSTPSDPPGASASPPLSATPSSAPVPALDAAIEDALGAPGDAGAATAPDGGLADDPMTNHVETKEELLALFTIKRPPKRDSNADVFLDKSFGTGTSARINQGNKALAKHAISKARCLAGLEGLTIQTEEQREQCGGFENMVPIHKKGKKARTCIDVFEFPNKPCELPVVWVAPVQAKVICELQGKRLCAQEEWMLACRGDPDDGKDQRFAYGDEMDLDVCNTNKSAVKFGPGCDPDSAKTAWKTCATNTEPSGSFPRCRSRFGVFDQHGNVAEIMTRLDPDGQWYSQLKGSAFFYVDVARKPDEPKTEGHETYPDQCNHDPRWHVEPMDEAWHVNYHLGFRCCKTVR